MLSSGPFKRVSMGRAAGLWQVFCFVLKHLSFSDGIAKA